MAEDAGNNQEDDSGIAPSRASTPNITPAQARALALRTADMVRGSIGRAYRQAPLVFSIEYEEETDTHYMITVRFQPEGEFEGAAGLEEFSVGKDGVVESRRILRRPIPDKAGLPIVPIVGGLAGAGAVAIVIAILFAVGAFGSGDGDQIPAVVATATPEPTPIPTVTPIPIVRGRSHRRTQTNSYSTADSNGSPGANHASDNRADAHSRADFYSGANAHGSAGSDRRATAYANPSPNRHGNTRAHGDTCTYRNPDPSPHVHTNPSTVSHTVGRERANRQPQRHSRG